MPRPTRAACSPPAMDRDALHIPLKYCSVYFEPWGCRVQFPGGEEATAIPHNTPHYRVIAHRLGYGDDTLAYCHEHELCHELVAEFLHDRPSSVLWNVAIGRPLTGPESAYEEIAAQTFQRFLRANERPIVGGVRWDEMKARALDLLKGANGYGAITA